MSDAEIRLTSPASISSSTVVATLDRTGSPTWPAIAATNDALFWQRSGVDGVTTKGDILRLRLDGGAPEVITEEPIFAVKRMFASRSSLFVHSHVSIYELDLDAPAVVPARRTLLRWQDRGFAEFFAGHKRGLAIERGAV